MVKCFQWRDIWGQAWIKTRRKSCTYLKTALSRQKWQDIGLGEGFLYLRIAWREINVSEAEWVRTGNQKATWSHSNANLGFKYIYLDACPEQNHLNFGYFPCSVQFKSVTQSCLTLSAPWTAALQASLPITNTQSLLKLMSIESVMPSNHLILSCPLLLQPSIFPRIRVFSTESVLHIRWPKYWSFRFSISPSNE